jgi:hypothetical protein
MKVLSHTGGLHNILRYETTNRSPDGEITSKIQKGGAINKKLIKREYDKPPDNDNAPVNKDEEEDVPKPGLDVDLHLPSKQFIQQDHPVEAHAAVRDGVPDVHVDEAQDAKEFYHTVDDWPDGQAGDVRDDVQTAGGDTPDQGWQHEGVRIDDAIIQAKEAADDDDDYDDTNAKIVVGHKVPNLGEADDTSIEAKKANVAHEDIYETVVVGPKVPRDEEGGEDDPIQRIVEQGGRKSKMTQLGLFANQYRTKLFKAMHESTYQRDVKYDTFQEDGSSAKNVMRMNLHHRHISPQSRNHSYFSLRSLAAVHLAKSSCTPHTLVN